MIAWRGLSINWKVSGLIIHVFVQDTGAQIVLNASTAVILLVLKCLKVLNKVLCEWVNMVCSKKCFDSSVKVKMRAQIE